MLQSWIDGLFHGAIYRPPCTLSNQMFRGATKSFGRGGRPPRAPRNSTTAQNHQKTEQ